MFTQAQKMKCFHFYGTHICRLLDKIEMQCECKANVLNNKKFFQSIFKLILGELSVLYLQYEID